MNVIFLDIDGVLNTFDDLGSGGLSKNIHAPYVYRIERLVEKTESKTIMISTWTR
ncbi:MAG: HAD domain-containing protein, partial [Flavobacteriales bacterium]